MKLSACGQIAKETIEVIAKHFPDTKLWTSVIMPNHIHLLLSTVGTPLGASKSIPNLTVGKRHGASAPDLPSQTNNLGCLKPRRHDAPIEQDFHHNSRLSVIIGQIKSTIKRDTNKRGLQFQWQPRFHESIVRNQYAFDNIMNYIDTNVENWCYDTFNANRIDNSNAPWRNSQSDAPWRVPTSTTTINDYNHEA